MKYAVVQVLATIILGVFPSVKGFFAKYKKLALLLFTFALLALITVLFSGCATYPVSDPQKEAEQTYRKDLRFKADGKEYEGVAVLPRKTAYEITLFPEGNIDRLIIQSCNREIIADKPKTDGWFNKSFMFKFLPLPGMEDNRTCPIEIASLEEKKTRNGFAYIDFQDVREEISLQGHLKCNGEYSTPKGVGICQAAAGLRQSVFFQTQTLLESVDGDCDIMESDDGYFWEWNMPRGKCIYYFVGRERHKNGKRLAFRLNSLGYTVVPVR